MEGNMSVWLGCYYITSSSYTYLLTCVNKEWPSSENLPRKQRQTSECLVKSHVLEGVCILENE